MPKSATHNEIILRPPPGTRFYQHLAGGGGADIRIEFQRGREREIVTWLRNWIDTYIEPEAIAFEQAQARQKEQQRQRPGKTRIEPSAVASALGNVTIESMRAENELLKRQLEKLNGVQQTEEKPIPPQCNEVDETLTIRCSLPIGHLENHKFQIPTIENSEETNGQVHE